MHFNQVKYRYFLASSSKKLRDTRTTTRSDLVRHGLRWITCALHVLQILHTRNVTIVVTKYVERSRSIHAQNFELRVRSTHQVVANQKHRLLVFVHRCRHDTLEVLCQLHRYFVQHPDKLHAILAYAKESKRRRLDLIFQIRHLLQQSRTQHRTSTTTVHNRTALVAVNHHVHYWQVRRHRLRAAEVPISTGDLFDERLVLGVPKETGSLEKLWMRSEVVFEVLCLLFGKFQYSCCARYVFCVALYLCMINLHLCFAANGNVAQRSAAFAACTNCRPSCLRLHLFDLIDRITVELFEEFDEILT